MLEPGAGNKGEKSSIFAPAPHSDACVSQSWLWSPPVQSSCQRVHKPGCVESFQGCQSAPASSSQLFLVFDILEYAAHVKMSTSSATVRFMVRTRAARGRRASATLSINVGSCERILFVRSFIFPLCQLSTQGGPLQRLQQAGPAKRRRQKPKLGELQLRGPAQSAKI